MYRGKTSLYPWLGLRNHRCNLPKWPTLLIQITYVTHPNDPPYTPKKPTLHTQMQITHVTHLHAKITHLNHSDSSLPSRVCSGTCLSLRQPGNSDSRSFSYRHSQLHLPVSTTCPCLECVISIYYENVESLLWLKLG